jgi:hypothetical protein
MLAVLNLFSGVISTLAMSASLYSIVRGKRLEQLVRKVRLTTPAPKAQIQPRAMFVSEPAPSTNFDDLIQEPVEISRRVFSTIPQDPEAQTNPARWRQKQLKSKQ